MATKSTFRLYILGHLNEGRSGQNTDSGPQPTHPFKGHAATVPELALLNACNITVASEPSSEPEQAQVLTMLATYRDAQAVTTVELDSSQEARLTQNIRDLRACCVSGFPELDIDALRQLGGELFKVILTGPVRNLFYAATGSTKLLPFEILVEDHRIASWPWEYLCDPRSEVFICQEFHPISRVIFKNHIRKTNLRRKAGLHILVVIGVLLDDKEAPAPTQVKSIEEHLRAYIAEDRVTLKVMAETSPEAVISELDRDRYDIVHFYGHAGFDTKAEEGYLQFDQRNGGPKRWYANAVGQALAPHDVRLAFLNACNTAVADPDVAPSRSSVAAALLSRGIPAVIATQFEMPISTADLFASLTYNALALGKPVVEAMSRGRQAMNLGQQKRFFDWGIPVLYATDPNLVIFPRPRGETLSRPEHELESDLATRGPIAALGSPKWEGGPTVSVERTIPPQADRSPQVKVAIVDLNARIGYLPEIVEAANRVQTYYGFEVHYLPLPTGSVRADFPHQGGPRQLLLHSLEDYLSHLPQQLGVERVCCLTSCLVAGKEGDAHYWNRFAGVLQSDANVFAITTYNFADYAIQINVSFAKATLYLCLAMLIATGNSGRLNFHEEIVGCPLDLWNSREDFIEGLRHMRFDHAPCREKIEDPDELSAIDQLLALQMDWTL